MKKTLFVALMMIASIGTALADNTAKLTSPKKVLNSIKTEVANSMKDPSSAQFKDVTVYKYTDKDGKPQFVAVGQVNAKNSFGGYVGFTYFSVAVIGGGGIIDDIVVFPQVASDEVGIAMVKHALEDVSKGNGTPVAKM